MLAAVARGRHRWFDAQPWVLDDPFATLLIGPEWMQFGAAAGAAMPEEVLRQLTGGIVVRSRYAEDQLAVGTHLQYVMLGAGLDSFVWRRADLLGALTSGQVGEADLARVRELRSGDSFDRLRVFEVDEPATLAWKRQRAEALALPGYELQTHVPVDFEVEDVRTALERVAFDWSAPTLVSWLGVTMYLTESAIRTTLSTFAACAPGSRLVLTYVPPDDEPTTSSITPRATISPAATSTDALMACGPGRWSGC